MPRTVHLPDSNSYDFYLWGSLKHSMYKMNSHKEELKNIWRKTLEITYKELLYINLNLFKYVCVCVCVCVNTVTTLSASLMI